MKKFITIILTLTLVISLCACSAKNDAKNDATKDEALIRTVEETGNPEAIRADHDKAVAYVNSVMDTEGMTQSDNDEDVTNLIHNWGYENEVKGSDIPMDITLDEKTFTIGKTTVKELRDMGMTLDISSDTVEANTFFGFTITKGSSFVNMDAGNFTDSEAKIDTLPVTEITTTGGGSGIPFTYNNITEGSDLKTVLEIFGKPSLSATLTTDSFFNRIKLEYSRDTVENGMLTTDYLNIFLDYDADNNIAKVINIVLGSSTSAVTD